MTGILPLGDEAFHKKYQVVDVKFNFDVVVDSKCYTFDSNLQIWL